MSKSEGENEVVKNGHRKEPAVAAAATAAAGSINNQEQQELGEDENVERN